MTADRGQERLRVYENPNDKSQVVVYPTCWLLDTRSKKALSLNCSFRQNGDRLFYDSTWGAPSGVEWGDPKMGLSLWSALFRRPKFNDATIEMYDGTEWIVVSGLARRGR